MVRRNSSPSPEAKETLRALRRAAKRAFELGIQTGTPVIVWKNNKMVDLTKELKPSKKEVSAAPVPSEQDVWQRGEYTISTDRSRLDIDLIHDFISNHSYWGIGRARDIVQRSIDNSMAFGVYHGERQVGFARIVTDYATFAWVADVFVVPEHRGRGLSKWLMEVIIAHPELQGFRRWVLATKDAHRLYEQFGFIKLHRAERWMERPDPNMKESPDYWQR